MACEPLGSCSHPTDDTSGSGFFCYALAWGINKGLLDREKYSPVVNRVWKALTACVQIDGRLRYVQQIADRPADLSRDDTQEYGVGAFLLAGEEMAVLMGHELPGR